MLKLIQMSKLLLLVGFASCALASCSNDTSGTETGGGAACNIDAECGERGVVCLGGSCGVVTCAALSDCGANQLCAKNDAGESVCTAQECTSSDQCNGGTCTSGLCVGGDGTNPQEGCTTNEDCATDEECNSDGDCVTKSNPTAPGVCFACADSSECEGELACSKVGPTSHCVATCTQKGDCDSGWDCYQEHCVPGIFQCVGCMLNGCPDGQHCNAESSNCEDTPAAEACEPCQKDGECGPGLRCFGKDVTKYCVPDCGSGTCPENGQCSDVEGGIKVCSWNSSGPCCFGAACGGGNPCDLCTGATPHCDQNQACVSCTNNTHCSDPTPLCDAGVCVEEGQVTCTGGTPHYSEAKGKCCECLNSTHCNGLACDSVNCVCTEDTGTICDTCSEPYPACGDIDGQFLCVQCASDDDCGGTCNLETFSCNGNEVPASGNCVEDGCTPATLMCDSATGLCFDEAGNCDSVAQFCTNGGECHESLWTDCLGFPPLPSLGGAVGSCGCELGPNDIEGLSQGNCPAGLLCGKNVILAFLCGAAMIETPNVCQPPG
ncbi:MAG: hypothetical protein ACI9OJ_003635 [Myxococcota bacterium]|jgi:hypothetical protein